MLDCEEMDEDHYHEDQDQLDEDERKLPTGSDRHCTLVHEGVWNNGYRW